MSEMNPSMAPILKPLVPQIFYKGLSSHFRSLLRKPDLYNFTPDRYLTQLLNRLFFQDIHIDNISF